MAKYRDWLKAEQTNINPAGTPVIVRPSETVGAGYAALTLRNEQIRNTPESARGGYSALAPVETVSASVPKLASDTPDWAKRTPTEQARVNAAQARAQAEAAPQGYSALAPATKPVSPYVVPESPYNYGAPKIETATKPATPPETVPKTDAGSPSTGETELTGYAKYLAQNPELAEADRRAEAEYARALPTYGALAERMAQAGIHGGYSDYLQGVAYAQMQNAKENAYATYAENAEAKRNESTARVNSLYTMLADSTYKDADGNDVQGYGLAYEMSDDAYAKAKETLGVELQNKGVSADEIAEAFARVNKARTNNVNRLRADAEQAVKGVTDGATSVEELYAKLGYTPSESDTEGSAFLNALNQGVEYGLISPASRSAALKENLSIYSIDDRGKSFAEQSWKQKGNDLYHSVKNAIDYGNEGLMEKGDVDAVIKDATAKLGFDSIQYPYDLGGKYLSITLSNGTTIKADYAGAAPKDATAYLNENYGNLPLAMYNGQLYYQTYKTGKDGIDGYGEIKWYKLKTKAGSAGSITDGDNYFKTVALIMMQNKGKYHLGLPDAYNNKELRGSKSLKSWRLTNYDIVSGKVTYYDSIKNTIDNKALE